MLMSLSGQFARRLCTNTTHPALQKESMSQRRQSPARSCLWDCSAPRSLAEELMLVPSLLLAFQMSGHRVYMPRDRDLFLSLAPDREYNGNAGRRHSQHRHLWNQESCRFEDSKLWRSSDQVPEGTHLKWLWYCPGESRIGSSFSCWNMEMRARSLGWDISVEDATDPDAWVHLAGTEGSWGGRGLVPERLWKSGVNYIAVLIETEDTTEGPEAGEIFTTESQSQELYTSQEVIQSYLLWKWRAPLLLIHLIIEHGSTPSALDNTERCQNEWCRGDYWKNVVHLGDIVKM